MVTFEAGDVALTIDPSCGARISSLRVGDLELIVGPIEGEPFHWGCYPMAPWAGRVRDRKLQFEGKTYPFPINMDTHAIHGTTYDRPWQQQGETPVFVCDLGEHWPFPGYALQRFNLTPEGLTLSLEVHAESASFPAACGWHPWFPRQLARGGEALLNFKADAMYQRLPDFVIDGTLTTPPPEGPWDDCFTQVQQPVQITWPNALHLDITSDTQDWVVYNMPVNAMCVEPMTGPPDAINIRPRLVTPNNPLTAEMRFSWQRF